MSTKEAFHKLIDEIEDEEVLKGYYELLKKLNTGQSGKLWESLTEDEKEELLISCEESMDSANLISHEDVKKGHSGWLGT